MGNFFEWFVGAADAAGYEYLLIGGNAVNAYGYQRTTLDVDFAVLRDDLSKWKELLEAGGYRCFHETDAFCQFQGAEGTALFPVDLMLVNHETFTKLTTRREIRPVGDTNIPVASALHIIALKLHALRDPERAAEGKDMPDILGLIERCDIDTMSLEFTEILDRYADKPVREELFRRLELRRRFRS